MCTNAVIDANSIAEFQSERILGKGGPLQVNMEFIIKNNFILLDRFIYQEWGDCASSRNLQLNLNDWISDRLAEGKIIVKNDEKDKDLDDILRRKLSLGNKDSRYLRNSFKWGAKTLGTKDLDFYNPKMKNAHSRTRERILRNRSGPVAQYARKSLGVEITPLEAAQNVIPPCPLVEGSA